MVGSKRWAGDMAFAILHSPSAAGRSVDLHCPLTQLLDLGAIYANHLQENACLLGACPAYFWYLSLIDEILLIAQCRWGWLHQWSNPSKQKHCDKRGPEKFPINITWVFLYQLSLSAYCAVITQADTENREMIHLCAQSKDNSPFLAPPAWPKRKCLSWSQ